MLDTDDAVYPAVEGVFEMNDDRYITVQDILTLDLNDDMSVLVSGEPVRIVAIMDGRVSVWIKRTDETL